MPGRSTLFHSNPRLRIFLWSALLLPTGCSIGPSILEERDGAPEQHIDVSAISNVAPKAEPRSRYGNPKSYVVNGERYHTLTSGRGYTEQGIASWYGTKFHGRRTSSGEPYDMYAMSAAHKTLPLPTYARVTNLGNGLSAVVKINDRGPFHANRIIDLSYAAAAKLGILAKGTGLVNVQALDPRNPNEPLQLSSPPMPVPRLYIQVGAFGSQDNANRLRRQLKDSVSRNIRIEKSGTDVRPLFRVQVGPIDTVEKADALSARLTEMGIQGMQVVIE